MKLAGKVAIVTGAGAGIGRAIALRLAQDGADIVVAELSEDSAAATTAAVQALGRRALPIAVDVVDRQQVSKMVARVVEAFGKVDILVNNAGGSTHYPRPGEEQLDVNCSRLPAEEVPEEYWDYIIDVNLKSTFLCSQAAVKVMKRQGSGRIINLASVLGRSPIVMTSGIAYSCAKGGVIAFTRHLAAEVGSSGITVNAIAPGRAQRTHRAAVCQQSAVGSANDERDSPRARPRLRIRPP